MFIKRYIYIILLFNVGIFGGQVASAESIVKPIAKLDSVLERFYTKVNNLYPKATRKITKLDQVLDTIIEAEKRYFNNKILLQKLKYVRTSLIKEKEAIKYDGGLLLSHRHSKSILGDGIIISINEIVDGEKDIQKLSISLSGIEKEDDFSNLIVSVAKINYFTFSNKLSDDNKIAEIYFSQPGKYDIKVTFDYGEKSYERTINSRVYKVFPYDKSAIKLPTGVELKDIDKYISYITNQYWVSTEKEKLDEIYNVIENDYLDFEIIGTHHVFGILIETEKLNENHLKQIQTLKKQEGVRNIYNRLFEGTDVDRINVIE